MKTTLFALFLILAGFTAGAENPSADIYSQEYIGREGLPNFFIKAESGQKVKIAYFGGSITAQNGYRTQSLDCFKQIWSKAEFIEINAAIPGTGSELGVFRVANDVLSYEPDLVFIEFAVNDYDPAKTDEHKVLCAVEGIVRQIITANPKTDICFVYTIMTKMVDEIKEGNYPVSVLAHEKVASYYGLPSINMGFSVLALEKAGRLLMTGDGGSPDKTFGYTPVTLMPLNKDWQIIFSQDGVHPYTDSGHLIYTQAIRNSFEKLSEIGQPRDYSLRPPMNADNLEKAKMLDVKDYLVGEGWYDYEWNDTILPQALKKFMPTMKYTCLKGDSVEFQFNGRAFGIFDVMGPKSGNIVCIVDDKEAAIVSRFDKYCNFYRLGSFLNYLETDGPHTVKMVLYDGLTLERKAELLSERNTVMGDMVPYDDHCWHVGKVLLVGDIIEQMTDEKGRKIEQ